MTDARLGTQAVEVAVYDSDSAARLATQVAEVAVYGSSSIARLATQIAEVAVTVEPLPGSAYGEQVLADSPVGFWMLDETSGSVATDLSGNGNHGTYNGTPTLAAATIAGLTCPVFDGVDDFVSLPAISVGASPFSLEAVARCDVIDIDDVMVLTEREISGNHTTGAIGTRVGWNGTSGQISGGGYYGGGFWTTAQDGTWVVGDTHHLAYTFNGTTGRLYVDGVEVATVSATGSASNDGWDIGCNHLRGNFWNGPIAGVGLYSAVLSAGRIAAHFAALETEEPADPGPSPAAALLAFRR